MANKLSMIVNTSFCFAHLNLTIPKKIHIHIYIYNYTRKGYFLVVTSGEWLFLSEQGGGWEGYEREEFHFLSYILLYHFNFFYSAYTLKFLKSRTK